MKPEAVVSDDDSVEVSDEVLGSIVCGLGWGRLENPLKNHFYSYCLRNRKVKSFYIQRD